MKFYLFLIFSLLATFMLSSCYSFRYNVAISNPTISSNEVHGESSSVIAFSLFGGHSGSVQEAAENGNIETINRVEYEKSMVFGGLFEVRTTHVYGIPYANPKAKTSKTIGTPKPTQPAKPQPKPAPVKPKAPDVTYGKLKVVTPSECCVYENNKMIGKTNKVIDKLKPGNHNLEIRGEGIDIISINVTINQNDTVETNSKTNKLSTLASFPGGKQELNKFIAENAHYPNRAAAKRIKGIVEVSFIVTEKGTIKNIDVTKGIDTSLDTEAKNVVRAMPNWTPATLNGKNVSSWVTIPINFGN